MSLLSSASALQLDPVLTSMDTKAAIFDLDGTLVDNNAYHLQAWKQYLKNSGRDVSEEEYRKHFNGRTNKDVIEYIHNRPMSTEEAMKYALEKESLYRELYEAHIIPVPGLLELLEALRERNIPMAIATSGVQVNIDFMFRHIPILQYFPTIVNSTHISKGKPDPEIYLKAASILQVPAENCLVFEDAEVGVRSARAAGMKVIAITTTQTAEELSDADMIIRDYRDLL